MTSTLPPRHSPSSSSTRSTARPDRRRRHRRLQRHRRRHLLRPDHRGADGGTTGGRFSGCGSLGGALAFAGAMAYAELAALRPRAGGEYVLLARRVRPARGVPHRMDLVRRRLLRRDRGQRRRRSRTMSAGSSRQPPTRRRSSPFRCRFVPLIVSRQAIVALVPIAVLSFIHIRGLGPGRIVQNVLAALKASALAIDHRAGFHGIGGGASGDRDAASRTAVPSRGMLLALVPVMFSYSGWNAAVVCRRGDPRSRPQCAARARPRHRHRHRDLCRAERAVSVRRCRLAAACRAAGAAARRRGRAAVRRRRPATPSPCSRSSA